MGHRWPYTNFHELNQDWIVKELTYNSTQLKQIIEYLNKTYIRVGYLADVETLVFFIPDTASYIDTTQTILITIPVWPPKDNEGGKLPWLTCQN